jgi:hypothetical protein
MENAILLSRTQFHQGMSRFEIAHPSGTVGHLPFNPHHPVLGKFPSKLFYLKHPVVDFVALP